jgi:hypothetical protein
MVMVGHHDLDAERLSQPDFLDRGDRAVRRNQQPGAAIGEALDGRRRQAVAIVDPVGQEPVDVRPD